MHVVKSVPLLVVFRPRKRNRRPLRRFPARVCAAASRNASPDVVGFANLCVDVRIPVPKLPEQLPGWRESFMHSFEQHPPQNLIREPGGLSNTLFVTSRLGMRTAAVGYVADDFHGHFCRECLKRENVDYLQAFSLDGTEQQLSRHHPFIKTTAVCLVIVDPMQRHLFCSHFQVRPGPVFRHHSVLTPQAMDRIRGAKALWMSGYALQECSQELLEFLFGEANRCNTATFFDPGPCGVSLAKTSNSGAAAVTSILRRSDVIFATEEEAAAISGKGDPLESGRALMQLPGSVTKWVIIKRGSRGSLFFQRDEHSVLVTPGFRVDVSDTVGCGDSFAAAVVYGYLHRHRESPQGVMELANAIGAVTATECGAGRNVADLDRVRSLLEEHHKHRSRANGRSGIDAALDLVEGMKEDSWRVQTTEHMPLNNVGN